MSDEGKGEQVDLTQSVKLIIEKALEGNQQNVEFVKANKVVFENLVTGIILYNIHLESKDTLSYHDLDSGIDPATVLLDNEIINNFSGLIKWHNEQPNCTEIINPSISINPGVFTNFAVKIVSESNHPQRTLERIKLFTRYINSISTGRTLEAIEC